METITIHTDFIKLQDLLKLTHQVSSGGEGKIVIQLYPGDVVSYQGRETAVARQA